MNLSLTQEELKALLDLVYTGNTVLNGLRDQEEKLQPYAEMEQKIFALAKEAGIEDTVVYEEEFSQYMPTQDYEEGEISEIIDAYDDQVFWDELVVRMARRDALNELGDINPDMSKTELNQKQLAYEDLYDEEIELFGLTRLKIVPIS